MARDDAYGADAEGEAPSALAFVHDHAALVRRFLLAELLAPPLALRASPHAPHAPRASTPREELASTSPLPPTALPTPTGERGR